MRDANWIGALLVASSLALASAAGAEPAQRARGKLTVSAEILPRCSFASGVTVEVRCNKGVSFSLQAGEPLPSAAPVTGPDGRQVQQIYL